MTEEELLEMFPEGEWTCFLLAAVLPVTQFLITFTKSLIMEVLGSAAFAAAVALLTAGDLNFMQMFFACLQKEKQEGKLFVQ